MAKLNWSTTNSQVTDEIIYVTGATATGLYHDMFYSKAAKPIVISTGAGGSGTVLTNGSDYTVAGIIATVPNNIASIAPDVIYSTVAITNAAYHSTTLYCSYYPLGDLWEAADITQLIMGTRLAPKDISGSNQTTLLTAYEPGGGTSLQDGGKIHVSWENGDGTYYHKFTSGWTLYNDFVDLAPGDGSSTFAWCGYGSGGLTLIKDEANSRWIVETDGCFDKGSTWKQYTDKQLIQTNKTVTMGGAAAQTTKVVTWIEYAAIPCLISAATRVINSNYVNVDSLSLTVSGCTLIGYSPTAAQTYSIHYQTIGEWRD